MDQEGRRCHYQQLARRSPAQGIDPELAAPIEQLGTLDLLAGAAERI
jgi:hypothetical protein